MPFDEILKRHVKQFFSPKAGSQRDQPTLEDDLHEELRDRRERLIQQTFDPGREEREAAEQAAAREEMRTQPGTGQMVTLEGIPGRWEAVELAVGETDTATFSLVDRDSGDWGQLGATDDGSLVLDLENDQYSARIPDVFWSTDAEVGIRLDAAELRSDGRLVRVTCDLRAPR